MGGSEGAEPVAGADPIRVAQVVTKFTAGAGGITLRGALALDPTRFAVTIFAGEDGSFTPQAERAGFEVVALRHMRPEIDPKEDVRGLRELIRFLGTRRFDIVHTHSAKAGALGRVAAHRVGVPAIVHSFHGFPFHEFQSPWRRRAYIAAEKRLARITHHFVTDGTMVAAEAVRLKIAPPERVRAIASPIDQDVVPATDSARRDARRLLRVPPGIKLVGTVSRLDYQKAPLDLVRAVALLGRADVCMVWIGDGELRRQTEEAIRRHGLSERFVLLGNRSDVPALLPGFDVFVSSSLYEGLPCALVEAMACGIPVAATAVNSVPEIVVSGKTGLLARPADPPSLARAIGYLLDRPDHAARMVEGARAHIAGRFTPAALGRDLTEVYELVLGRTLREDEPAQALVRSALR